MAHFPRGPARRVYVSVRIEEKVHRQLGLTAFKNDVPLQSLASAILADVLNDPERLKAVIERMRG